MELDITHMVESADEMIELSGSVMEHGENAGPITWNNSKEYARDNPLLTTDEMRDAARSYFRGLGAWPEEEIAAWSEDDLQAIVCQDVAGSIREMEAYDTNDEYQEADGRCYKGDNGRWYFYMGN